MQLARIFLNSAYEHQAHNISKQKQNITYNLTNALKRLVIDVYQ